MRLRPGDLSKSATAAERTSICVFVLNSSGPNCPMNQKSLAKATQDFILDRDQINNLFDEGSERVETT